MIIFGIIIATLSILSYNHVFGDYLDLREDIIWTKPPIVCLADNMKVDEFSRNKITRSVLDWKYNLWWNTQTHDFDYTLRWTNINAAKWSVCDVFIKQGIIEPFGLTKCLTIKDVGLKCNITISQGIPEDYFITTITHEVGHSLGLGHRLPYDKCDFAAVVLSFDVMMQQAGKHQKITDEDLKALISQYGKDGWAEPNNYYEYYEISERPLKCV